MNKALVILAVLGVSWASPVEQTVIFNEDGSYKFNFDTGKDAGSIFREEERQADGTVIGRYSYEDPTGSLRVVNYRAGRQGFVATGDVGVAGAPPAQVPAVVPPIEDQPLQEEPGQDIQPTHQDEQDKTQKPVDHLRDPVPEQPEPNTEPSKDENDVTPKPDENANDPKDQATDDAGRKREAGSPPLSYADDSYPFAAPLFGKRRLDFPEDDGSDKAPQAAIDDDADKKPDPAKPPTSFVYHFGSPFVPTLHQQPEKVEAKKPEVVPESKAPQYYYYAPQSNVQPSLGYFPSAPFSHVSPFTHGAQFANTKFQQPSVQSHFHSGPPKAWAYVPISSLAQHLQQTAQPQQFAAQPQQFAAQPQQFAAQAQQFAAQPQQQQAAQPQSHPTSWAYIQPHAVSYVPSGSNTVNPNPVVPNSAGSQAPFASGIGQDVQEKPQLNPAPLDQSTPVGPSSDKPEQVPFQSQFYQRPAVQHYQFKGPSNTYGYYYQY